MSEKSRRSNTPEQRLVRIETRLTNLGRYLGADLRVPPPPNQPDQAVFIDDGKVYVTSQCTVGMLTQAVYRHDWADDEDEVPVILNGIVEIGTIHPHDD